MDDDARKIVEMADNGSAETAFIIQVAEAIHEVNAIVGPELGMQILERLTESPLPSSMNEAEAARFRTMRKLLVSSVATLSYEEFFSDPTEH